MNAAGATASRFFRILIEALARAATMRHRFFRYRVADQELQQFRDKQPSSAAEIASMTTSQIAQRLHNFTSRRLSARSIIAHNHLFLFLSSPFISNFLFANEFRITFTLFHDVVRNFPIGEQWDSCNSLARAKSENRVSPEFPDSLRLIVTDCHRSYRRVE